MPDRPIGIVESVEVACRPVGVWERRPIAVTEWVSCHLQTVITAPPLRQTVSDTLVTSCIGYGTLAHTKRQRWNHKH